MMSRDVHGWYADDEALCVYVEGWGLPFVSVFVEGHFMECGRCRACFVLLMAAEFLMKLWEAIRLMIEALRLSVVERLLGRMGVSVETSRLLAVVSAFGEAWLVGMVAIIVFSGVVVSYSERFGIVAFLLVALLALVVGVAVFYGGAVDSAYELAIVALYSALWLFLLCTAGVLVLCMSTAVVVGLVLFGSAWLVVAWFIFVIAGVILCLVLFFLLGPVGAVAIVGTAWSATVFVLVRTQALMALVDPTTQLVFAVLTVAALGVLIQQQSLFDRFERQS